MTGSGGTNNARGLGSIFGGVRADPNVDVFGGAVYRTQGNYKDGNGTEIGNTGNEIAAGLMKLTVRPAEGHEVKFGGVFQDYQYSIGQLNRGPTTTAAPLAAIAGTSVYASDAKNYTRHHHLEVLQAGRQSVRLECDGLRQPGRERSGQDLQQPHHHRRRRLSRSAIPATISRAASATAAAIVLDTLGIDVYNTTRFNVGDWRNAVTLRVRRVPG